MVRFQDYVAQSRRAETVAELASEFAKAIAAEGYENCILTSVQGRRLGEIAWYNFPDGYVQTYVERRWDRIDPVLACSLQASRPFFWNDAIERMKVSAAQLDFMNCCKELHVHSGIIFPFHGPGGRLAVVSISRRLADEPNKERLNLLHAVSVQTWTRFLELSQDQLFRQPDQIELTERELEILRWCKDGKTRPEIGEILSISHKTVEFHLTNLMNKLGAVNQVSAVVIALQRGLIEL